MSQNSIHRSPQQLKIRRLILMRIAFILLVTGSGISILTSFASSFYSLGLYLGEDEYYFFFRILSFSNSLITISSTLSLVGNIFLLISLAKIGESGSLKLKRNSKITFFLLILGLVLNLAFSYVLSNLATWEILRGQDIATLLSVSSLVTIGVDSLVYIFLGFTINQLKTDHQVGSKPLITTFIYPIMFALRLALMFNIFSSTIVQLIASLVVSIMGFVILIVFFSRALVGIKRVIEKIRIKQETPALPSRKDGNYCANCGTALVPKASFCANCGHPIK
jgi:hypothetical protein